ncbi:MAG: hypothetical protein IKJ55_00225, partial [Clostridia bacterium]|nr:hypothetical protein [Clostridia bacterium]
QESIEMLKDAYEQGVHVVVATPHCHAFCEQDISNFLLKRAKAYEKLTEAISHTEGAFPKIILGAEVALYSQIVNLPSLNKLCIDETNYILLEPMFENFSEQVGEWIFEIGLHGLKPIIAHIDRYTDVALEKIGVFQMEVVLQINASAFLSMYDRRRVRKFVEYNKIFVIGSDMHNMHFRKCEIKKAYKRAKRTIGSETEILFRINGKQILGL